MSQLDEAQPIEGDDESVGPERESDGDEDQGQDLETNEVKK